MPTHATEPSRLGIRRLHVNCVVPSDHPSPEQVRHRVADLAEQHLFQALQVALDRIFPEADQSLCFIQRLNCAVDVNIGWEPGVLTHHFSARLGQQLIAQLHSLESDPTVIRFKSPADYLAAFLMDLTQGQAWTRWYYKRFDGLRVLPLSAAIRTALCNHRADALPALHQLAPMVLRQILSHLTEGDSAKIVEALAEEGAQGDGDAACEAVEATLSRLTGMAIRALPPQAGALWLYLETTRRDAASGGCAARDVARSISRCVHYSGHASAVDRNRLFQSLEKGELGTLNARALAAIAEWLLPLLQRPEPWRRRLLDTLRGDGHGEERPNAEPGASCVTLFGGIFYLLPLFLDVPFDEQIGAWSTIDRVTSWSVLRWLLIAKLYGRHQALAVARDPLVQALVGLPPYVVSRSFLATWQRHLVLSDLEQCARSMALRGHPSYDATSRVWILTREETESGSMAVLLDAERGVWLWAIPDRVKDGRGVMQKLRQTCDEWPAARPTIVCAPYYYDRIAALQPPWHVLKMGSGQEGEADERKRLCGPVAAQLETLGRELDQFSLPPEFGLSRARDRALTVVAQTVLRAFASKLPGFAWSSGPFLRDNVFACTATVEEEPERYVVQLSPSPLQLLLNLTGLSRAQFSLPWFDQRPIAIFPSQSEE